MTEGKGIKNSPHDKAVRATCQVRQERQQQAVYLDKSKHQSQRRHQEVRVTEHLQQQER